AGNRTTLTTEGHQLTFTHDELGRETTRTLDAASADLAPVTLTHTWDPLGRLTEQALGAGDHTLRHRSHTYRADGHLTATTDHHTGDTTHYQLDTVGRPLTVTAENWSETYAYDTAGNQTHADWPDRTPNRAARGNRTYVGTRIQHAGRIRYTHDAAGRTTVRRKTRLSRKPDIWRYTYNAEDQLTTCTTPDGTLWTYTYDPLGRRTAKHQWPQDRTTTVSSTLFTWDGTRLAEQTDTTTGVTLTWDHQGHRPLTQLERKPRTQSEYDSRFFAIITDLVGTPTELIDHTGHIAAYARTTLWGTTTWNRDATAHTPLRFPGQYADPETALHYNHHRHYDPLGLAPCEIFYRMMSLKEFEQLGPNGEITVKGTENFVTQEKDYIDTLLYNTRKMKGRKGEQYQVLVRYEMTHGTREALLAAGRGSGKNRDTVLERHGIELDELNGSKDHIHVKQERFGLNFGLRPGSADIFNERIGGVTYEML
ncbi:hypothetical protein JGS22_022700, partial [Streptomyces sp. P38-E01]